MATDTQITETFETLQEALEKYPDAYVAIAQWGDCKVCGQHKDLRAGACFHCSGKVDGEPIRGGHRLWERDNPSNTWFSGGH